MVHAFKFIGYAWAPSGKWVYVVLAAQLQYSWRDLGASTGLMSLRHSPLQLSARHRFSRAASLPAEPVLVSPDLH